MGLPVSFKIFSGDQLVGQRDFDQDIIKIGRLATAHLKLDDQKVSRIHAVVEVAAGRDVSIIDMGSAEGTFVNGEKVNKIKLKDGDTVLLGETRLVVAIGAQAGASVPEGSGVFTQPVPTAAALAEEPANEPEPAPAPAAAARAPAAAAKQPQRFARVEDDYDEAEPEGPVETAPEPVPDGGRAVLEVQVRWGHTVIEVQHHARGKDKTAVTIGPGGDIAIDSEEFAPPAKNLFTVDGSGWTLNVPSQMTGFVRTGRGVKDLKGGASTTLGPDLSGELQLNDLVLAFRFLEPRKKVIAAPFAAIDYAWMNTMMTTVFMSAAFLATLILYPQDTKSLEEDLFQSNNRFTQLIINPDKKKKNDFLAKLEKAKGGAPAAAKGTSGKMGKQDVPKDKPQGKVMTKAEKRAKDEQEVANKLEKLFGSGSSSAVFQGGDTGEIENLMGGLSGKEVGAAYGFGGLGERGSGPGGGGTSTSTFGVGKIGTRGRGGGNSGFGAGGGGLGGKADRAIDISQGTPVILGSLDKEIIRRVIRENIAQIKYCYERELTRTPGLNGKVQVKFVIGANGNVQSAVVAETSMGNKTVESCLTGKVRGWMFPKPKGGGIVIVTYPFIFKQGG